MIEVGLLAHRVLCSGRRGRIAAVFERCLYAVFDDDWICVGAKDDRSGPSAYPMQGIRAAAGSLPGRRFDRRGRRFSLVVCRLPISRLRRYGRRRLHRTGRSKRLRPDSLAVDDGLASSSPTEAGLAASGGARQSSRSRSHGPRRRHARSLLRSSD